MNKHIDKNIGKIFGCYEIVSEAQSKRTLGGQLKKYYVCKCVVCENIKTVNAYDATHTTSPNCDKCRPKPEPESLIGMRFGRLTVISRASNKVQPNGSAKVMWNCLCDCGNERIVPSCHLKDGHTQSCGCKLQDTYTDIVKARFLNKRFNKLTVMRHVEKKHGTHWWECLCDCGKKCTVSSRYLQNEDCVWSCGCEGSKAENDMVALLGKKNIIYERQYKFDDCRDVRPLPFDFAIFNNENKLIFLIELHGEQHYYPFTYCSEFKEQKLLNFEDRVKKDQIKEHYCIDNGIPLLIIKYTDFKKLSIIFDDYYERNKNNQLRRVIEKSENDFKIVKLTTYSFHSNGIYQIDLQSKTIIKKWDMISDICKKLGFWDSAIVDCCARRQHTAYGYGWAYAEDDFDLNDTLEFCLNKKIGRANVTLQIDINTDEVIKEWGSASDAARAMGCVPKSISACCKGEIKTCKGFAWKYKKDWVGVHTNAIAN